MKRKLLSTAVALMCAVGTWAQSSWTGVTEITDGSKYYIRNTESGYFLSAGAWWGSFAVQSASPVSPVTVTKLADGKYKLIFDYKGDGLWCETNENETGLTGWCYTDRNAQDHYGWNIVNAGGTNFTIQMSADDTYYDATKYLAPTGADCWNYVGCLETAETYRNWTFIAVDDIKSTMASATPSNPVDVTIMLAGWDCEYSICDLGQWLSSNGWAQSGTGWKFQNSSQPNFNGYFMECWNKSTALGDVSMTKTLSNLPNGTYEFSAYVIGGDGVSLFVANSSNEKVKTATATGSPALKSAQIRITDGTLKVGLMGESTTATWIAIDNMSLKYLGNAVEITNATFDTNADGWSGTEPAVNNTVAEFYNKTYDIYQSFSGLTPGIYAVEVQGFYRNAGTTNGEFRVRNQENLCAFLYATGNSATYQTALTSIFDEAGNGGSAYSTLVGDVPNSMAQAATFFGQSLYTDNRVFVEVGTDGALTIGLKKETAKDGDWTLFDNFSVTKSVYTTLADAYAAEWTTRKSAATTLLNSSDYTNIPAEDAARTALVSAVAATPSDLASYYSALTTLRSAVNGFKASKYAYDQYESANAAKSTTYAHITGTEKTAFENAESNASAIYTATITFVNARNAYDEYYYENETATRLGAVASGVSAPTTAAEAETAAHAINVINYNSFVAQEYADVSGTTLGAWTDDNVLSRTAQHWSGDASKEYFEMNTGYNTASAWTMSRQQTVHLSAGSYVLKVAARVSAGADAELSVTVGSSAPIVTYAGHHGDNGKGITTDGVASYDEGTFANTTGRGFEWRYIPFTLASDGDVTLKFYAINTSGSQYQYVSFCDLGIWTDPKVAARTELLTAINNATAARMAANEGTGIFQIPATAGTTLANAIAAAQSVYDNEDAVLSDLTSATTGLGTAVKGYQNTTLNAPTASTRYKLTLANKGALTFQTAKTEGGYGMPFQAAADYKAQTFFLTHVSGNTYNLSFVDFDGNTRYICTRADYGEGGTGTAGIRTTDDSSKALSILIQPAATANVFYMINTADNNNKLGAENDGDFYTTAANSDWSIAEATEASVELHIAAGKLATRIFPFTPELPDGVEVYSCADVDGTKLKLTKVDAPEANKPYILYSAGDVSSTTLTGWGTAAADSYADGLLTGVYTAAVVPAGSYVLQTQNDVQAFYKADGEGTSSAYRAYVTESHDDVKMFTVSMGDIADAIKAIRAAGETTVRYNLAGQRVSDAQKGIVIVNGKKVLVK